MFLVQPVFNVKVKSFLLKWRLSIDFSSYQRHFAHFTPWLGPFTVLFYEEEPPLLRSTPWGAPRLATPSQISSLGSTQDKDWHTVKPVFYVPLFYMKPVFYVTLSRTKRILFMVSKLYFTGTSHLREENLVPWGHVKYRFHCIMVSQSA